MSVAEQFDAIVVGSGEAGKYLAWEVGKAGQKVAVIERGLLGGACPNIACLPSKNIIHTAKIASFFQHGDQFGMETDSYSINMEKVRLRKRKMVEGLSTLHQDRFRASGATLLMGEAHFIEPKTLEVIFPDGQTRLVKAEKVFLNVGTRAALPAIPGIEEAKPLTHVEALDLAIVPEELVILGAGYVGLEFAQAYRRFGSNVIVIDHGERLLPHEDIDVSEALLHILCDEGIEFRFQSTVEQVEGKSGKRLRFVLQKKDGTKEAIEGSHLLAASGRTPNTQGLRAQAGGVTLTSDGYIQVNDKLETTAPGVWAMGDCAGSPKFTHVSYNDFRVVSDNLKGKAHTTKDRLIPWTLFTDPELARVGLNEIEAQQRNIPYRIAKLPMAAVLRTRTLGETQGFLKALIGEDDRILGFTALGVGAGEMMAMVQIAMIAQLPYTALRDAIFTHPTLAEGLLYLFSSVPVR